MTFAVPVVVIGTFFANLVLAIDQLNHEIDIAFAQSTATTATTAATATTWPS